MMAEEVSRDALDAVAHHGRGIDLARDRQTEATGIRRQEMQTETAPVRAGTLREATLELGGKTQPLAAPEAGVVCAVHTFRRPGVRRADGVAPGAYGIRR